MLLLLVIIVTLGLFLYFRKQQQLDLVNSRLKHVELLRADERTGRIRAEQKLAELCRRMENDKKLSENVTDSKSIEKSIGAEDDDATTTTTGSRRVTPIGYLRCCFKERNGTPRQGSLVPDSRASVRLQSWCNPTASLDGLASFSHVWLVFLFHQNTNDHKLALANLLSSSSSSSSQQQQQQQQSNANASLKSKIRPPRLGGASVGLYATRTPHRHNSIGLSVVKLDRIENDVVWLSGIDLLDRTPILDIKPYLPYCDSVPMALVPHWILTPDVKPFDAVRWTERSLASLSALLEQDALELYRHQQDFEACCNAIQQTIALDCRSANQRRLHAQELSTHSVRFDTLSIEFEVDASSHSATIVSLEEYSEKKSK
jgi:tRNA (Thr-GGU) A37 N-methylase